MLTVSPLTGSCPESNKLLRAESSSGGRAAPSIAALHLTPASRHMNLNCSRPKISQTSSRSLEGFVCGEHCQAGQLLETAQGKRGMLLFSLQEKADSMGTDMHRP